ncbi:uncharacterized protein LOC115626723 isoform X1 [Scaptodrosophila lebanonensis]|uniref:Uncharacterized protein LOC115626723 isoform X1 n=2 Tax=Drosophila lebanonensis TaxID=7225 RepID=A0A6J2TSY0_DROLE|nr:uncharacterized protein LOC115626723 isoform X1 [Scaptodrosophila lebanonensis]
MRLVYDLLLSSTFETRMVLQNHNTVVARSTLTPNSSSQNFGSSHNALRGIGPQRTASNQRPIIDLLVAMVAIPILILCALQLEKNLHDIPNSPQSRWLVFALGIGMLVISVIICGYVTHRMGVCIWAGPIDEAGNRVTGGSLPHINSQNDVLRIVDSMPPSYDSVVKFELPPPPYDCIVVDMEQGKDLRPETSAKGAGVSAAHTTLHI